MIRYNQRFDYILVMIGVVCAVVFTLALLFMSITHAHIFYTIAAISAILLLIQTVMCVMYLILISIRL